MEFCKEPTCPKNEHYFKECLDSKCPMKNKEEKVMRFRHAYNEETGEKIVIEIKDD